MGRRLTALALCLLLMCSTATADGLPWRADTPAQIILKDYITTVNGFLSETGEQEINSLFEMVRQEATLGITDQAMAEIPEGVEITVRMYYGSLDMLTLRVSDPDRFARIAGCLIRALNPEETTLEDAMKTPLARAGKAKSAPTDSFQEEADELNGTVPRTYYAYYPNQYHDGVNWMQMILVFPIEGYGLGGQILTGDTATPGPRTYDDFSEDYEGYYSGDDYTHFEVFLTPTPEPDSAAAEEDPRPE